MHLRPVNGPVSVVLPDGRTLNRSELPPPGTRWHASRKAMVAEAVEHGLIDAADALQRYQLSPEELDHWRACAREGGASALLVKVIQHRPTA